MKTKKTEQQTEKKITAQELADLKRGQLALENANNLFVFAQLGYKVLVNNLYQKYGLDSNKQFSFEEDGTICELKTEKVKVQEKTEGEVASKKD